MRRFTSNPGRRSSSRQPASANGFNNSSARRTTRSTTRSLFNSPQASPAPASSPSVPPPTTPTTSTSPPTAQIASTPPPTAPMRPMMPTIRPRTFFNRPPLQLAVALPLVCPEIGCNYSLSAATGGFSALCTGGHRFAVSVALDGLGPSRLHIPFTPALVAPPPSARPAHIRRPAPAPTPIRRRAPPRPAADVIVVSDEDDDIVAFNRSNQVNSPSGQFVTVSTTTLAEVTACSVCYEEVVEVGSHVHGSDFTCIRCWRRVSSCPICRADFVLV